MFGEEHPAAIIPSVATPNGGRDGAGSRRQPSEPRATRPTGRPRHPHEWLQSLVDSLDCILYEIDPATFRLTYVNENAERVLGYPLEAWLDQPTFLFDHIHPDDRDWVFAFCAQETAAGRNHQLDYRMVTAAGEVRWFRDVVTVLVEDGRAQRLRGVMIDITARHHGQEERRRLTEDLQALAWRLLRVQEDERRRNANDLHDGALQMITGAQTYFETLMANVETPDPVLSDGVRRYLANAVAECRGLIATMRPPLLEDFGLVEGLGRYLAECNRRAPGLIEFQADRTGCELGEAVESHLFRIVQEAVANALQHSGSNRVRVTLRTAPARLVLQVRDWGAGFDVAAARLHTGPHVGLLSMQERAALVGARFALQSVPGKGTTITVELPLPPASPNTKTARDALPPTLSQRERGQLPPPS